LFYCPEAIRRTQEGSKEVALSKGQRGGAEELRTDKRRKRAEESGYFVSQWERSRKRTADQIGTLPPIGGEIRKGCPKLREATKKDTLQKLRKAEPRRGKKGRPEGSENPGNLRKGGFIKKHSREGSGGLWDASPKENFEKNWYHGGAWGFQSACDGCRPTKNREGGSRSLFQ